MDNYFAHSDIGSTLGECTDHIDEIHGCACDVVRRRVVNSDPREVMDWVIAQEASRLQLMSDDDVKCEAQAIAEAESQRAHLTDRLEAALGSMIRVTMLGEALSGTLVEFGSEILVLDSERCRTAVALASVTGIEGLPRALRNEARVRAIPLTWSAVLREWSESGPVRFTLVDGSRMRAVIEWVGGDHLDIRYDDGHSVVLMLGAIRCAAISR